MNNSMTFVDIETTIAADAIADIGAIKGDGAVFHGKNVAAFIAFLEDDAYLCGHNILHHDMHYLAPRFKEMGKVAPRIVDTLHLSPLLFPKRPYHRLVKDDKLQTTDLNNPVNDARKAQNLLDDEVEAFARLDESTRQIYYGLLHSQQEFSSFFDFIQYAPAQITSLAELISRHFTNMICAHAPLDTLIRDYPIELAYSLALIQVSDDYSITPPWVLKRFPETDRVLYQLRGKRCLSGCSYCDHYLDARRGLKRFFGYDAFRTFNGQALQEQAVEAAINNESLLAIFPTGGGKSLTFQIPALISGENQHALTVVISPLLSLMKDQVDNLELRGITAAVTINGLLDPIERRKSFQRVKDGSASILYISPEMLRSRTIEHLLKGRSIARIVVDEAHCFSSWGQDFRVDYLYIATFIKMLLDARQSAISIPVSCFTATAKQKVIEDIRNYFKDNLGLELRLFRSEASRTNLTYRVIHCNGEEDKYQKLRDLIERTECPAVVYVSRTAKAFDLATRLHSDGITAKPFHGRMDTHTKTENQNEFIAGTLQVMVATSAFGMGVDKKDIGLVVHYDISDSLENYVQESGRAGRDENLDAECVVLYNEEDLNKHFILLNQTRISIKEIQQIWRAIKEITRTRSTVSNSALEIARKAGWDDTVQEIETRVKTAIAALEEAGYLKRGQNVPRVFADSILARNMEEASTKIRNSLVMSDTQKQQALRIIQLLISSKKVKEAQDEAAETRVDYIADILGMERREVIDVVLLLKSERILADTTDMTAYISGTSRKKSALAILNSYIMLEQFLAAYLDEQEAVYHLKELLDAAISAGCGDATPQKLRRCLNFWKITNRLDYHSYEQSRHHVSMRLKTKREHLKNQLEQVHVLATFVINYLYEKQKLLEKSPEQETLIEFSLQELIGKFKEDNPLFPVKVQLKDIEESLFFLSRMEALTIEGGFLVTYNRLTLSRLELNNKIQYKNDDYKKLEQFYTSKIQQIHIVGEYAKRMLADYQAALTFVSDYFSLNYFSFINKYFPGSRKDEIKMNITPAKFRELFGALSPSQLRIIQDAHSRYIVVAAGPGSGKTRVLVHKLASLLLMEDVKHEQLLMLTFSRAAATEFKTRLFQLVGNAAAFIEIKTFHSYCFDLLGTMGSIEKSDDIVAHTVTRIQAGEVEPNRITKTVLVIDEAQDMRDDEFALVRALAAKNEEMRIIAVGDDDQNIYSFRGSDSAHFQTLLQQPLSAKYELVENYRSATNLVAFTNAFVRRIQHRFKELPIVAQHKDNGSIRVTRYRNEHLICPTVEAVRGAELTGTTVVLTQTNDEAIQLAGSLQQCGVPVQLIQTNNEFNLINLLELRSFLFWIDPDGTAVTISVELWEEALHRFTAKFGASALYDVCCTMFAAFKKSNSRLYVSDLKSFIYESKLEDFVQQKNETVYVSTMHKAKGKEFDTVFIMLNRFVLNSDSNRRLLYVAMTRARKGLWIHTNSLRFTDEKIEGFSCLDDTTAYDAPQSIVLRLSHRDVQLGYFEFVQHRIKPLLSGCSLGPDAEGLTNAQGELVLKFSKAFLARLTDLQKSHYRLVGGTVDFVVLWKNKQSQDAQEHEYRIVLPQVRLQRMPEIPQT
jgi:ATP-dependent DNA helicase RecQ